MALLPLYAVYQSPDADVLRVDVGNYEWAGGTEGIGGFSSPPLGVGIGPTLPIACADIVSACVSEDVIEGIAFADVLGLLAHDDDQFGFAYDETGVGGQFDGVAGADDCGGSLVEGFWACGLLCAEEVRAVVTRQT